MITEKYCNEILQQYPEYITKDQMYRICHISKKTCLFLLESGLVPNIDSGKKTRRFKIKTVDVIQYLKDRDDYPELFKAPDGFYKGKGGDKKAPSFDEVFTQEDLIRMRQYYERLLKNNPDVMSVEQVAQFTGYNKNSVSRWCGKKELKCFYIKKFSDLFFVSPPRRGRMPPFTPTPAAFVFCGVPNHGNIPACRFMA